ncbi:hypothetical protein BU26DRAFT_137987 [Trematosphaeria pertusa]|uniref:Uncharacterized protein n=1 Tax=Trematosphaeria pertusa TaxID=390896 RepID=A0A6A6IWJ0_9PLEO|nr:uncharacterized protein BU26DRAFT_137987 [Trematosphaeria pertusa]KAF2254437.1 hypothetical protein BU26DRAFT_137987 [Trematosphaeria pertusa]
MDFGTPKPTPPRETPRSQGSRPHSYHAPDAWSVIPDLHSPTAPEKGLQAGERLGVLPSPAKSAFSLLPQDREDDVPPVPPIPEGMGGMQSGRTSQESATHRLLQSVIRHSTPPAAETSRLRGSPVPKEAPRAKESNERRDAEASHQEARAEQAEDGDEDEGAFSAKTLRAQKMEDDDDDRPPLLNHDSVPPRCFPEDVGQISDVSPPMAASGPEPGEISPVVSAVGADRLDGDGSENEDGRLLQPEQDTLQKPRLWMGDVSPMFAPVPLALGSPEDGPQTPVGETAPSHRDTRPAYETELIGGDVSPISSRADGDEEATPTRDNSRAASAETARQTREPAVEDAEPSDGRAESEQPDALTPHAAEAGPAPPLASPQQRLSASPYQVVHAVQYVPSHSSCESWEQDSVAAPSHSDGSQLGDKHDAAAIPPVPHMPSPVAPEASTGRAMGSEQKPVVISISNSPAQPHLTRPEPAHQEDPQFPKPDLGKPGIHRRSESLLSKISSMVSADGVSISPTSSHAARSRPSSANRQRQVSPAKTSPLPAQIEEESNAAEREKTGASSNDDFDLYADHNGIVKDVRDESGQPLRVATPQPAETMNASQTSAANAPKAQEASKAAEEEPTRYSDERPMSFVSGPRDAHGRPQDQINRPGTATAEERIPPVPPTPDRFLGTSLSKAQSNGASETQHMQKQNGILQQQSSQVGHPASQSVSPAASQRRDVRTPPHSNVSPPPPSNASPPPQPTPPQGLSQRPLLQEPRQSNGVPDPRMQDPRMMQDPRLMVEARMRGMSPGQPYPQDPRIQAQMYGPDPRRQGQPIGSPTGPRNQFELQQQMMQRQAIDPRLHAGQYQYPAPGVAGPHPDAHLTKKEEKSSRPRLSSVFKGRGSKSHPSAPQVTPPNDSRLAPNANAAPGIDRRGASYQSTLGDLPEQVVTKKERRSSAFGSPSNSTRPESIGTESHISQDSTRVQAADSRLDLRYPQSPAPFKGIPPQQPPPGTAVAPQSQPQRASTSGVSEIGKKKRFSALGNLFNRSGSATHSASPKSKLSKEDKKAQKAQKHTTAPPFQPPTGREWPPQPRPQPQFNPAQQGMQYGMQYGPPGAVRPFPGMQNVVPQQTMSPTSPQGMPPQGMPPKGMRPQGIPQQYMQPPPAFQHNPHIQRPQFSPEGSAYMDTRQIAQARQAPQAPQAPQQFAGQPMQQPPPSSRPDLPITNPSLEQRGHRAEGTVQAPPPGGYYKPDSKQSEVRQGGPAAFAQPNHYQQQQQVAPQHPPSIRSVSSPSPAQGLPAASPPSQRRVSSPLTEPRYETPQIPAAYRQVSGAYVSPSSEQPPTRQSGRPSPAHYGRQYSDPQMQPISPQVSAPTQMPPNQRNGSDSSTVSIVSPISNPSPGIPNSTPVSNQRQQKPRMSSISEATHQERPWHLNFPHGATEQEIVRARQRQYMEQQLAAQEQMHAERTGRSPSPRSSHTQSASPQPPQDLQQSNQPSAQSGGGFREVLPRSSPQPYPMAQNIPQSATSNGPQQEQQSHTPHPLQPLPIHPGQGPTPAAYPLPMSPDSVNIRSPVNPVVDTLPPPPPPKIPHSPMHASFPVDHTPPPQPQQQPQDPVQQYQPAPPEQQPDYEQQPPADEPPPYSGPGMPNDGIEKERPRPPNIITDAEDRGRHLEPRQRQASFGILQHPQPASMAASPQRSSADMGAEALRRQLLEQEERERQERLQRAEIQRAESARERQERERARARARELERSVSGGARVGSLRSAEGSGRANGPGWERRGSTTRPVFELPAEEDDEPVMRATSFPGQEWVPTWTED